jgi:hypothetical protein
VRFADYFLHFDNARIRRTIPLKKQALAQACRVVKKNRRNAEESYAGPAGPAFHLSTLSPSPAQKRLAQAVVISLVVVFILITAGLLSGIQTKRVDAFLPAYLTAMLVCDSITAILLYAQFSILRSRAILVIASGYVFTALILIPYALEFPGLFVPGGLLGGGIQSAATIYVIWHCGFPLFVIAYAFAKGASRARRSGRERRAARSSRASS